MLFLVLFVIWIIGAFVFYHRESMYGVPKSANIKLALIWPFMLLLLFLGWLLHLAGFRIH